MTETHDSPRINGNRPIKKSAPVSDLAPPVRPPGAPTQTEFMMADDLWLIRHVADPARATASDNKPDQQG
jgi:hypothetical protein